MNPLDRIGELFQLSLMNPNPSAGRNKGGPWHRVSFEVDAETFDMFQGAGELSGLVIEAHCTVTGRNEPINQTPQRPAAPGPAEPRPDDGETARERSYAQQLHVDRYWHNPKLWAAMEAAGIYSQKEHKAWIESQPCCGKKFIHDHNCIGQVCAHHTPSAALPAAGRGRENPRKPPNWYTVPVCHGFHNWAHSSTGATRDEKQELMLHGIVLTASRIEHWMKADIGLKEGEHLTKNLVEAFEAKVGLR